MIRYQISNILVHIGRCTPSVRNHSMKSLLEPYNTYNWQPDPMLSDDDNYMDLTLLVTRSSKLKHGSMACILVQCSNSDNMNHTENNLPDLESRIISVATNQALYKENESDIHAEIVAIGQAASAGRSTLNCTAYITMPPCRKCFPALLCAGVRRIVSRHKSPLHELASKYNIEMICLSDWDAQRDRTNALVQTYEETLVHDCTENDANK